MSIIINGMNMPKGNSTKNLLIYSDGKVFTGHKDDANYSAEERKTGKWIDYNDEGYVECPFCHSATNCEDNKDELHYCFSCGAKMEGNT